MSARWHRKRWHGLVAGLLLVLLAGLTKADRRYRDRQDGTVRDNRSRLVWLAHANCFGSLPWERAKAEVAGLEDGMCGLTDGSEPGDWRLPTEKEWTAAVDCSCDEIVLTDDHGTNCYTSGESSFHDVQASEYWSSTRSHDGTAIQVMSLADGFIDPSAAESSLPAWPVREASGDP